MSSNTTRKSILARLLLLSMAILTVDGVRRGSSMNSVTRNNINVWGTNTKSKAGWSIDKDVTSRSNQYHVIGASRSGFYLSDDHLTRDEETKVGKLVRCTRYGQRVKKTKGKHGHESIENQKSHQT